MLTALFATLATPMAAHASPSPQSIETFTVQQWHPGAPTFPNPNADFSTISEALDPATNPNLSTGDTIHVLESWYSYEVSAGLTPILPGYDHLRTVYSENITFPSFDISIIAAPVYPNEGKVIEISAAAQGSTVTIATPQNGRSTILDGFTITNGVGSEDPWLGDATTLTGGGIQCLGSRPTIRNCIVSQNTATLGGGLYASIGGQAGNPPSGSYTDGPLVIDCEFKMNSVSTQASSGLYSPAGGGVFALNCSPELINCTVTRNSSTIEGGGLAFHNSDFNGEPPSLTKPVVDGCDIRYNTAGSAGGGFSMTSHTNPQIRNSQIVGNKARSQGASPAGKGGGLYWIGSKVDLYSCFIGHNVAAESGGGIAFLLEPSFSDFGLPFGEGSTLTHCTIAGNKTTNEGSFTYGGGFWGFFSQDFPYPDTVFENCLIVQNESANGAAGYLEATQAQFRHCTIAENTATHPAGSTGVGGLMITSFYDPAEPGPMVQFLDSIIARNSQLGTQPTPAWNVQFMDVTPSQPGNRATFDYTLMETNGAFLHYGAMMQNQVSGVRFATGSSFPLFPINTFYLPHTPEQSITLSAAYNTGSGVIGPSYAVDGRKCRTALGVVDFNIVDLGFHYPNDLIGLP